jgi:mRNA interferase HigB
MHVISIKMLRQFWLKHPNAESMLREWHTVVENTEFRDFNHLREYFNSADYVAPYTIFNIAGNNFRLVVIVRYSFKRVYVHQVMTHREYDDWNKLYRQGKT